MFEFYPIFNEKKYSLQSILKINLSMVFHLITWFFKNG